MVESSSRPPEPGQGGFSAAKERINHQLATLKQDLKAMHDQDVSLLRQLMNIHFTIASLNGKCPLRSDSHSSVLSGCDTPVGCESPLPKRLPPMQRMLSAPASRLYKYGSFDSNASFDEDDDDPLGNSYNSTASEGDTLAWSLDLERLEHHMSSVLSPVPAAFRRLAAHPENRQDESGSEDGLQSSSLAIMVRKPNEKPNFRVEHITAEELGALVMPVSGSPSLMRSSDFVSFMVDNSIIKDEDDIEEEDEEEAEEEESVVGRLDSQSSVETVKEAQRAKQVTETSVVSFSVNGGQGANSYSLPSPASGEKTIALTLNSLDNEWNIKTNNEMLSPNSKVFPASSQDTQKTSPKTAQRSQKVLSPNSKMFPAKVRGQEEVGPRAGSSHQRSPPRDAADDIAEKRAAVARIQEALANNNVLKQKNMNTPAQKEARSKVSPERARFSPERRTEDILDSASRKAWRLMKQKSQEELKASPPFSLPRKASGGEDLHAANIRSSILQHRTNEPYPTERTLSPSPPPVSHKRTPSAGNVSKLLSMFQGSDHNASIHSGMPAKRKLSNGDRSHSTHDLSLPQELSPVEQAKEILNGHLSSSITNLSQGEPANKGHLRTFSLQPFQPAAIDHDSVMNTFPLRTQGVPSTTCSPTEPNTTHSSSVSLQVGTAKRPPPPTKPKSFSAVQDGRPVFKPMNMVSPTSPAAPPPAPMSVSITSPGRGSTQFQLPVRLGAPARPPVYSTVPGPAQRQLQAAAGRQQTPPRELPGRLAAAPSPGRLSRPQPATPGRPAEPGQDRKTTTLQLFI